ncbi:MAG: hypothetical protein COA57_04695 [Flavobacteriales bacterium]|nr:MAG: hypothetical protein COA57_04695 [Flavobacteriales bacterium]
MKKTATLFSAFLLAFLLVFSFSSCKEKGPAKAKITVVNMDGAPVSGIEVRIFCTPSGNPGETQCRDGYDLKELTDTEGIVLFEFDLPAVLKIEVNGKIGSTTYYGEDFVELEAHETVDKTVTVAG